MNFRGGLIRGLKAQGYEVVVAAPRDRFSDAIERDLGYRPTTTIDQGVPRFVDWFRGYHGV